MPEETKEKKKEKEELHEELKILAVSDIHGDTDLVKSLA
jgi:hypothetical protein